MPTITKTGTIQSITALGNGKFKIDLVDGSYPIANNVDAGDVFNSGTVNSSLIVLDPYANIPNLAYSDFNAVINNALIPRQSNIFWDLDYSTNAIQAVNQEAVISASQQDGDLPKAFIQDYNYYSTPILRRNYLGAKSTAPDFNELAVEGGFGQLPVVQSEGYYFAFFNWVGGTSPEWGNGLEDRSAVNVRYYIGEDGNVIEPINDSDGINLSIVQQGFEQDSNAILSFNDKEGTTSNFSNLEGKHKIFKSGQIPKPIIYSQTSSIGPNTGPDLFTGSLEFVQGDQQESSTIGSYRLKAFTNAPPIDEEGTVSFSTPTILGDSASFASNIYEPTVLNPSSTSPATTLTFEAYLETDISNLNGSSATFFIQKNSDGAGWVNVSSNIGNILEPGVVNSITLTYTDPNATTTDDYRLQITSVQLGGLGQFTSINANSYFKVNQSPPPNIGPVGPDAPSPSGTNYWTKLGVTTNQFRTNALTAVLGQRQKDISGSGFNPITFDFNLQIGDEIRFQGTETQTYTINSIDVATNPSYSGALVYTVDRNLNLTNPEMNWFLVRRYVDDPSYLILEVDKPAGGTSTGVLTPEYFYGATEEKVDNILKELKKDNLI
jgi:hypothetical protein